jgi:hypothetical protein
LKTISVRDAAQALSISPRAVLYRREKGQLKGLLIKNDHGVAEYRIYPNKEIVEGLRRMGSPLVSGNDAALEADIVDAVTTPSEISFDPCDDETVKEVGEAEQPPAGPGGRLGETRSAANNVADELWNNLISRYTEILGAKDQLIGEMRTELEEKDRQLRLLPDLERRAEEEQKSSELRALEVEALKKQIEAIAEEKHRLEQGKLRAEEAANEAQSKLQTTEALKEEIQGQLQALRSEQAEEERKVAEIKAVEVAALHEQIAALEEAKLMAIEQERRTAQETAKEIERINSEKAAADMAIRDQLTALTNQVQQLQQPWWKKWFTAGGE